MFLMERSEPSLVPEWLKGTPGGLLPASHPGSHEDDGNTFSRHRGPQQTASIRTESNSIRGSASSDRTFLPTIRRSNTGNSLDRVVKDTDNLIQDRLHYNLNRSVSSKRSYDNASLNRSYDTARDPHRGNSQEWEQDNDRELRPSESESLSVFSIDEREKFREHAENRKLRVSIPGKYDGDPKLKRSLSMGLSPKKSESISGKNSDVIGLSSPLPSISGSFAVSMQKAVFERNFPSLSTEDKSGSILMSPSGIASIASPRLAQQSSSRLDIGRAGLSGGFNVNGPTINGGSVRGEIWSSALAEAPSLNGNIQNTSMGHNGPSINICTASSVSSTSSGISSVSTLNMAEAIAQNPPRVRVPPQISVETQRLESLALKQSRQLIPMTPTLPKAMSLSDKSKLKATRNVDNAATVVKSNQLSGSLQSVHRTSSTKPDMQKHSSQGKLLVLKPSKDGSGMTAKPEGNNGNAIMSTSVAVSATHSISQLKKPHDVRETSQQPGLSALRVKDSLDQDKRSSVQAQNRSEFFNTLRKKSTLKSESVVQPNSDVLTANHGSEEEENGGGDSLTDEFASQLHNDGDRDTSIMHTRASPETEPSAKEKLESMLVLDSEEEEAAFMRSLGWEENAEGSELTEEEINAFYQMREKVHNVKSQFNTRRESWSSGISSSDSDSDSDDQLHESIRKCQ